MYKINDFSKKSNTSIRTLRYYDEINLFKPEYIDTYSGYRYYIDDQLKTIAKINKLKDIGLSLTDIKEYLKTYNIEVIINQKEKYLNKIKKIEEIISMEDKINYSIKEENYKKYIEVNGTKMIKTPVAIELKENNARYFIINKNNEYMDDFVIYKDENLMTLDRRLYKDKELVKDLFNYLKELDYNYICEYIPSDLKSIINSINLLKDTYQISEENKLQKSNDGTTYEYIKYTFNL